MVIQRAVSALAIIECFDVIEDLCASLGVRVKATAIDQLQFEGGPEAFHSGVVIAVAPEAHGGCHRSLQNHPAGVESKPATLRCFIHIKFLDPSKGLFDYFVSAGGPSVARELLESVFESPSGSPL